MTHSHTASPRSIRRALAHLAGILEAGEKGYATAAASVNNRGLKLLFKSCAQQRVHFKEQILAELERLGGERPRRSNLPGKLHRGRLDIFAALTIGQENVEKVVIREVLIGERAALRTYERLLKKDLPPETREIAARQFGQVFETVEQARDLRGRGGQRLVLRLYDTEADATRALDALKAAGFPQTAIGKAPLNREIELYEGKGTTIHETALSGAAGGALWGAVNGVVAGFTVLEILRASLENPGFLSLGQVWALTALACVLGGAFVGGMLGAFIGWGVTGGDRYLSEHGIRHGESLVKVNAETRRALEAWKVLRRVELEGRLSTDSATDKRTETDGKRMGLSTDGERMNG